MLHLIETLKDTLQTAVDQRLHARAGLRRRIAHCLQCLYCDGVLLLRRHEIRTVDS